MAGTPGESAAARADGGALGANSGMSLKAKLMNALSSAAAALQKKNEQAIALCWKRDSKKPENLDELRMHMAWRLQQYYAEGYFLFSRAGLDSHPFILISSPGTKEKGVLEAYHTMAHNHRKAQGAGTDLARSRSADQRIRLGESGTARADRRHGHGSRSVFGRAPAGARAAARESESRRFLRRDTAATTSTATRPSRQHAQRRRVGRLGNMERLRGPRPPGG